MKSSVRAGGAAWLPFPEDAAEPPPFEEDRETARREDAETVRGESGRSGVAERTFLRVELSAADAKVSSDFKRANLTDSRTLAAAVKRRLVDLIGACGHSPSSPPSSAGSSDFLRVKTALEDLKLRAATAKKAGA